MKITLDRENCSVCGTCWEACLDIFEQSPDDSFSQIVEKDRLDGNNAEGRPPAEFEDCWLSQDIVPGDATVAGAKSPGTLSVIIFTDPVYMI